MDFVSVGRFMLYSLSLFFIYKILAQFKHIKRPPLPPGPKAKFLVGNLGDLPPPGQPEWKHWLQHKDAYGTFTINTKRNDLLISHTFDVLRWHQFRYNHGTDFDHCPRCSPGVRIAGKALGETFLAAKAGLCWGNVCFPFRLDV